MTNGDSHYKKARGEKAKDLAAPSGSNMDFRHECCSNGDEQDVQQYTQRFGAVVEDILVHETDQSQQRHLKSDGLIQG